MIPDSLSDQIAQLIFARIGSNMRPSIAVADDVERISELIRVCPIGGLVVFNGDADTSPDDFNRLQRESRFPLLVSTDMERGLGQQLRGATIFPHAYAFSALGDRAEWEIEESSFMAACEALAAGVHISFSPVADVHSNPDNPIISIRSFGSTPDVVSSRVAAYIRGARRAGLLTTAKHFPGHGDTETDSHDALPVVDKSREALFETELRPFMEAIRAGADLVMTAHVAYPALDHSGAAATRSEPILTELLRNTLGFEGAVITDSLLMEGADSKGGSWAAEMVQAGVDILLDVGDPVQVHADLLRAVESGALQEERIQEAFERVWTLKLHFMNRFGSDFFVDPGRAFPRRTIGAEAHLQAARDVAGGAVSVRDRRASREAISMQSLRDEGLLFVLIRPHVTYSDPTAGSLAEPVRAAFDNVHFVEILPDTDPASLAAIVQSASGYGAVVAAAAIKPAAWHRFGLLPEQQQFVHDLSQACPIILAALGSPRLLDSFPDVPISICTFSDVAVSQEALVETLIDLFGGRSGN